MKKFKKKYTGFTLVELVITIAIVIILSVVSVPIYRGYTKSAKMSEAYALLGTVLSSQKAYFSQYGNFLKFGNSAAASGKNDVLGIDARGNKYVTGFFVGWGDNEKMPYAFYSAVHLPEDIAPSKDRPFLYLNYNITKGAKFTLERYDTDWID